MECCNQTIPTMVGEDPFEDTRCLRSKKHSDGLHLSLTMDRKSLCYWEKDYACECEDPEECICVQYTDVSLKHGRELLEQDYRGTIPSDILELLKTLETK